MFLTPSGHLTIGDFGLARVQANSRSGTVVQALGTPGYIAPELLNNSKKVQLVLASYKSDIYALGLILLEIWIGTGEVRQSKLLVLSILLTRSVQGVV